MTYQDESGEPAPIPTKEPISLNQLESTVTVLGAPLKRKGVPNEVNGDARLTTTTRKEA